MDKYNNSICRICGTEYHRCNCRSEGNWRKVTDTAEHYKIFAIIRDYNNEIIDARKANELLKKADTGDYDSYVDTVKEIITKIRKESAPVVVDKAQTKPYYPPQNKQQQFSKNKNNYKK